MTGIFKRCMALCLVLLLLIGLCPAALATTAINNVCDTTNLFQNGDFEEGKTNWSSDSVVIEDGGKDGSFGLECANASGGSGGQAFYKAPLFSEMQPNQVYELSFDYKNAGCGYARLFISLSIGTIIHAKGVSGIDGDVVGGIDLSEGDTDWEHASIVFKTHDTVEYHTNWEFAFYRTGEAGTTWFDNVSLAKSHLYDDACDPDCNVCGTVRTELHAYDSVCDCVCNVCGTRRCDGDDLHEHEHEFGEDNICTRCGELDEEVVENTLAALFWLLYGVDVWGDPIVEVTEDNYVDVLGEKQDSGKYDGELDWEALTESCRAKVNTILADCGQPPYEKLLADALALAENAVSEQPYPDGALGTTIYIPAGTTPLEENLNISGGVFRVANAGSTWSQEMATEYELFQAMYDVRLQISGVPLSNYASALSSAMAAGASYDIVTFKYSSNPDLTKNNLVEPLTKYITTADLWKKDSYRNGGFSLSLMDATSMGGEVYAVGGAYLQPLYVLWYNKKMLSDAGYGGDKDPLTMYLRGDLSWESVHEILLDVQNKNEGVYGLNTLAPYYAESFLCSYDTDLAAYNASGKMVQNLNDQKLFNAYSMLQAFCYGEKTLINPQNQFEDGMTQFLNGQTAAYLSSSATARTIYSKMDSKHYAAFGDAEEQWDNVGMTPVPVANENGVHSLAEMTGFSAGKDASSKGVECALLWAKFDSAYNFDNMYHPYMSSAMKKAVRAALDSDRLRAPMTGYYSQAGSLTGVGSTITHAVAIKGNDIATVLQAYEKTTQTVIDASVGNATFAPNVPEPTITAYPLPASGVEGDTLTLSVEATGVGLTYRWQVKESATADWKDVTEVGADTNVLKIAATVAKSGNQYRCVVTDAAMQTVRSTTAGIKVTCAKEHTYANGCDTTCNRCDATRTTYHSYTKKVTPATLKADGKYYHQCKVCGYIASTSTVIKHPKTFTLSATSYTYNGAVKTPTVTVKDTAGKVLKKDTDYTVTYASGRKNAGTYTVKITMKGNYSGTKTLSFKINPIDIAKCTVKLSATSYTYNGTVKTPSVIVKNAGGTTLTKNTHYTVTYATGRKNAGTYKVTVKMKGNYSGTKTLTFKINPISISKCKLSLSATSYTYDGKVKAPTVTVKNANGTKLTKNTHYTVTYASGRKNVGTYKVTIKMKGNYSGTKTLTFKINPAKTTVSKLTPATKSLKASITKKSTQVTGYQVQYSTSKTFKSVKTVNISSYKTTSTTIKSLKAKTTYYVRVRTYKTVGGVKYYSGWSTVKYAKTK